MDWADYKALCDRPDYFSFWMLSQSKELFEQMSQEELVARIQSALTKEPLPRPSDHHGPEATLMFLLDFSVAERERALACMTSAQANGLRTSATTDRGLGGFVEAWTEYAEFDS